MQWNARSGPSLARASGHLLISAVGGTSWNIPRLPADTATPDEGQQAVEVARRLISAAGKLLGQLSFFAQPAG